MKQIIDKYLAEYVLGGLNAIPDKVVPEMADPQQNLEEEWKTWIPIESQVTDEELDELETSIGHKLPSSFKHFLKYKHFYELQINECSFCRHPAGTWRASLSEMIFNGYPTEFLIDKGRIPFADWSDWGLLCFDTTVQCKENNYPIVLWDHEIAHQFEKKYADFASMIQELDKSETEDRII